MLYGILVILVFSIIILLAVLISKQNKQQASDSLSLIGKQVSDFREQVRASLQDNAQLFTQQLNNLISQVNERLRDNRETMEAVNLNMGQRLDNATKVVVDVERKLGELEAASARILEVGKDISGLEDILRAPKLRGILGELFLGNLLEQVLPGKKYFTLEYEFKNKEKVDAVIRVGDKLLPVDAKFPLENFRKFLGAKDEDRKTARKQFVSDLKNHVDAIADKYILPDEGTLDFALMYIPAENVYYEVIIKDEYDVDIFQYAFNRKVIPVSPNTLFSYLQVIIHGLKGMIIEKNVKEVLKSLGRLRVDFGKFNTDFTKLGRHLENCRSVFNDAGGKLAKLSEKFSQIDRLEGDELPAKIPQGEETLEKSKLLE